MEVRKTDKMLLIEIRHGGRDIRALLGEAFERQGTLGGAISALGMDRSTGSVWLSYYLRGRIERVGGELRLTFTDWPEAYAVPRVRLDRAAGEAPA